MPGIFGLITPSSPEWAESELQCMLKSIHRTSNYGTGTWIDRSHGVYLGWTRRKSTPASEVPLRNERNDVALVFSGEEFPEPGAACRLKQKGHDCGLDDTSYLVHVYEEESNFPSGLNGRFHGLVVDRQNGLATLFNDRYGMHRLYYHESQEAFYFSAEAKAILAVRPELRTTDPQGLGEFMACGCALENRSIFKGIKVLPPGAAWTFRAGVIEKKNTYFQPQEWENLPKLDPDTYYDELRRVFSENVHRYFQGKECIGLSLTGGLDTRMILAWHKQAPGSVPCYSFGSMYRQNRDVMLARRVAKVCGQPHQVIEVTSDFLANFPRYAERTVYLTDGCVEVKHSPDVYVNERAREIAPIRMTGNYGDEVLRHARVLKPVDLDRDLPLCSPDFLPYVEDARSTYANVLQCNPLSFAVFKQAPWHHYGLLALEESQLSLRTPYLDNDFVRTAFRAPESAFASNDIRVRLIRDGDAGLARIRTDLGFAGWPNGHFGKTSQKLHAFTMKAEYAYDYGMPQQIARLDHAFSALHLERLLLGRHKFYHFRIWYRDILSKYIQEMLLDGRTLSRPYLDRNGVETMVRGHLTGDRNYTREIHKVLTLELVHRLFLDAK
jgi:asparagine synthase (glutamine-hydrolysing)